MNGRFHGCSQGILQGKNILPSHWKKVTQKIMECIGAVVLCVSLMSGFFCPGADCVILFHFTNKISEVIFATTIQTCASNLAWFS